MFNMLLIFLNISFTLFFIGVFGLFFNKKNILLILISIEILLLANSFSWILFGFYLDDVLGEIFSILILTVAAAEASLGLSFLIIFYRIKSNITVELINLTKN
uniref:NADH dehydrogenase subunit 4L n=1 Tax=Neorhodella cyanea TaxID=131155 RepID=UPI001FCD9810|nr:NADH dehydrogenase subunit 4L [Neorhodella cyanea]UNJ18810.1 NADH dehydrogenase subunit 4L [Neorhodella cyanea]